MLISAVVIVTAVILAIYLLGSRTLRKSEPWQATVTPLASIMGSGFLVSAPLLIATVGVWAMPAMIVLLAIAYLVGEAIRFNIARVEPIVEHAERGTAHHAGGGHPRCRPRIGGRYAALNFVELSSHVVLAVAYVISVTFYLQLLAIFLLHAFGVNEPQIANLITSATLATITVVGAIRGLGFLEHVERVAVGINLAMIGALLAGLAADNIDDVIRGKWSLPDLPPGQHPMTDLRVLLGMLIVVQGFETSRFLGSQHAGRVRIKTMRVAQLISATIYIVFVGLVMKLFAGSGTDQPHGVAAIVAVSRDVSPVLPVLVLIAAAGSQFSAAVADDEGCSGLLQSLLGGRASAWAAYAAIGAATITLTWLTNVLEVISIASRAFALFYALQCAVATIAAARGVGGARLIPRALLYGLGTLICAAVAVLGLPADA